MPVKITADSTCDLSKELALKYDIEITPLNVTLGERTGRDGVDVFPDDIYKFVENTGKLSKTSAVNVEDYVSVFKKWRDQGYEVVHFCIGSDFSCCYQNANLAKQELDGVYIIDTENLSTGQGLCVMRAAIMAKEGKSAAEIVSECENMRSKVEASFVVDTIEYLHKGGRCSSLAAFGANVFHIKPCIEVKDGKMGVAKKYRGRISRVICKYVEERLKDRNDIDPEMIFITHSVCEDGIVEKVKELIREYQPEMKNIYDTYAGATVTTHCGPGTLGVLFVRK